ncbi:MAG: TIGR02996 domain-containing protein [Gemmataceae bacterium]
MTEEDGFLAAIRERPADDLRKLIYADWLEEQGDPRADYLRHVVKIRQRRAISPKLRLVQQKLAAELKALRKRVDVVPPPQQFVEMRAVWQQIYRLEKRLHKISQQIRPRIRVTLRELAAGIDPSWLALVSDPVIERCGRADTSPQFDFVCDRSWADLQLTVNPAVRYCTGCRKNVYYCATIAEAQRHARRTHCVALSLERLRRPQPLRMGRIRPLRDDPEFRDHSPDRSNP